MIVSDSAIISARSDSEYSSSSSIEKIEGASSFLITASGGGGSSRLPEVVLYVCACVKERW